MILKLFSVSVVLELPRAGLISKKGFIMPVPFFSWVNIIVRKSSYLEMV
jgi:hypothetical protein